MSDSEHQAQSETGALNEPAMNERPTHARYQAMMLLYLIAAIAYISRNAFRFLQN